MVVNLLQEDDVALSDVACRLGYSGPVFREVRAPRVWSFTGSPETSATSGADQPQAFSSLGAPLWPQMIIVSDVVGAYVESVSPSQMLTLHVLFIRPERWLRWFAESPTSER